MADTAHAATATVTPAAPAPEAASAHGHIAALDGLRGVAAIGVLLHHVFLSAGSHDMFDHGYLAVDFFFMLSGFVMGFAYQAKLEAGMSTGEFMLIRLVRLYPLILLMSLVGFSLAAARGHAGPDLVLVLLAQLLMAPRLLGGGDVFPLNGVQWSLFFELIANLAHALFARVLTIRVLTAVVAVGFLGLVAAAVRFGDLGVGWSTSNFWGGLARVTFGYAAGLLIFRLKRQGALPRIRLAPALIAALLLGSFMLPYLPKDGPSQVHDLLVVGVIYPFVLIAACQCEMPRWLTAPAVLLGFISYPLYATYGAPKSLTVSLLHAVALPRAERMAIWLGYICLALLLAYAVGRWYDLPVRRWLTRHLLHRSPRPRMAVASD